MEIMKGAPVVKAITEAVKNEVAGFEVKPKLCIVRVGENPGDLSYETGAKKRMEKTGILTETAVFPEDVENEVFLEALRKINEDPSVDGILLLRPLPKQIDEEKVEEIIDPVKDMDCVNPLSMERLFAGKETVYPCTPQAVLEMLDYYNLDITGKRVTVIGRSMVVGKPLAMLLLQRNATVTICHRKTVDLKAAAAEADILVTAMGAPRVITGEYVKPGGIVIDVGISEAPEGGITGDCDFESISEKASMATPVPGGVGSITTAVLAKHVLAAYKKRHGK